MNKTFLIGAQIQVSYYPDGKSLIEDVRIVLAPDEEKARVLYTNHWESQNSEYGVTYYPHIYRCDAALVYMES
jgi:hypothetical protein